MKDFLQRLTEQRVRAWNEAKEILDTVENEKRDFSAEEKAKWDRINDDIVGLDARIKEMQDVERREREAGEAREGFEKWVRPTIDDSHVRAAEDGDEQVMKFLRGEVRTLDVDLRPIAREKQAVRGGLAGKEYRDLVVVTAAAGGTTVPTTFSRQLYDFLEIYTGMRRTNATVITTSSGENMDFYKATAHGTAAIVGEGSALAEADPAFGKITLGSWKFGQLVQVSSELLADSAVDMLGFVGRDVARALARATDTKYVVGTGSGGPTGVVQGIGTAVTGSTGATGQPTFNDLIDTVYSVNEEYRANGAQWLMQDATAGDIRKLKDSNSRPLWEPSYQVGQPDRILGFPVVTDPNVAAKGTSALSIIFGDFSTFYIRDVGMIRFERSDEYAFANDLVTFRAILRTDSKRIEDTGLKAYRGGTA